MTNDLNDHFPHSLRSSLAEGLKTIETIGTIFFPCLRTLQSPSRSTLSLARARRGRTYGVCLRLASVRPLRGRLVCFSVKIRRLRSLRSLHQRLWIFALFLLWQATKSSARTFLACGGFKDNRDNRDNIFFLACAPFQS